jgi:hypothetical protein
MHINTMGPDNPSALDVIAARLDNDLLFADGFE